MVILLADAFPNRNQSFIKIANNIGFILLKGDWNAIEKTALAARNTIFLWECGDIFKNDNYKKADYILEIVRFEENYSKEQYEETKNNFKVATHSIYLDEKDDVEFQFNRLFKEWMDEIENKQTLSNKEIENIATQIIKNSGLNVNLRLYCDFSNFLGRYTNDDRTLFLYPQRIRLNRTREEAILVTKIAVCHELGHIFDPNFDVIYTKTRKAMEKLNKRNPEDNLRQIFEEYKNDTLTLEKNAWVYAKKFLPSDVDTRIIDEKMKSGLQSCEESFEQLNKRFFPKISE